MAKCFGQKSRDWKKRVFFKVLRYRAAAAVSPCVWTSVPALQALAAHIWSATICVSSAHNFRPGLNSQRFTRAQHAHQKMILTRHKNMCIMYGNIPKAGSSTIRRWFKTLGTNNMKVSCRQSPLFGNCNVTQIDVSNSKPKLTKAEYEAIVDKLREECFTFTFVRDPVNRRVYTFLCTNVLAALSRSDSPS